MLGLVLFLLAAPEDFAAELRAGLQALERHELGVAERHLQAAARLRPRQPYAWLGLARVHWRQNRKGVAEEAAQKAEQLAPADATVLQALTQFYADGGQWAQAAERATRYIALVPANKQALRQAAELWLRAGQPTRAAELARTALAGDDEASGHHLLGMAHAAQGQFAAAESEMREAVRRDLTQEAYHFDLAQLLLRRQRFAAAVEVLEDANRRVPNNGQLTLALGVAYYGERRFADAVTAFLQTTRLAPEAEQPYVFLGRMLDHVGNRLPELSQRLDTWARTHPRDHRGPLLQAKVLNVQSGEPAQVESLLRRSIALNGEEWESHFELGVLLARRRAFAEAVQELSRSAALNPREPTPHYHLARAYDRLGKPEEAAAARATHARLTANERPGGAPGAIK